MHFRTKSSQPVLPAALRELVSMEMILPGWRERSHVIPTQHEKSLCTNRSINTENGATSYLVSGSSGRSTQGCPPEGGGCSRSLVWSTHRPLRTPWPAELDTKPNKKHLCAKGPSLLQGWGPQIHTLTRWDTLPPTVPTPGGPPSRTCCLLSPSTWKTRQLCWLFYSRGQGAASTENIH